MENMLINSFIQVFERDLKKLETEIKQYPDDSSLWKVAGEINNSAGNLCLHLCGNLQNYIGALLGNTGYQRNRPFEFSAKDLPKEKLLEEIERTKHAVITTLGRLDMKSLDQLYPEETLGYPMTTGFFLVHLFGHLGYHLGQINYHRRLVARF
jgi:uncharacterized damage-inducible protein DinB